MRVKCRLSCPRVVISLCWPKTLRMSLRSSNLGLSKLALASGAAIAARDGNAASGLTLIVSDGSTGRTYFSAGGGTGNAYRLRV
jgi:hypothetical protein